MRVPGDQPRDQTGTVGGFAGPAAAAAELEGLSPSRLAPVAPASSLPRRVRVLLALIATTASISAPARADELWPGALAADLRGADQLPASLRLRALALTVARVDRPIEAAAPLLHPLLRDTDPGVRLFVARWLAERGDALAIDAATGWVLAPAVAAIDRPFGLDVLRRAPRLPPAARDATERALHDPDTGLRLQAIDVLRAHPLATSLPAVLRALDDDNREVRLRALRLAAASGDKRAVVPVIERLDDPDRQLRLEARRALGGLPATATVLLRLAREIDPADEVAMGPTGSDDLRAAAIDALGQTRAPEALSLLSELAAHRPPDDLARHAQHALGALGSTGAAEKLVSMLRSPPVSEAVVAALRALGRTALPALLLELDRGPPTSATLSTGLIAEAAVGGSDASDAVAALARAVEARPDLAPSALDALGRLGGSGSLPALARASESPDLEVRRHAFAGLLATGDRAASAVVAGGLNDADPEIRLLAARIAEMTGDGDATSLLAARLSDPDHRARLAAARALSQVGVRLPSHAANAALLASLAGSTIARDEREWLSIGDALERVASAAEGQLFAQALANAGGPGKAGLRLAVARALAAAHDREPIADRATVERLLAMVWEGEPAALAAADALGSVRWNGDLTARLRRAFTEAEPAVQARLCRAISETKDGVRWLVAIVRAGDQPVVVRAAAAWAARGDAAARPALEAIFRASATSAANRPLLENIRAALESGERASSGTTWTAARLVDAAQKPLAGRWVVATGPTGAPVWAMTDPTGAIRLYGIPGALSLRIADDDAATLAALPP